VQTVEEEWVRAGVGRMRNPFPITVIAMELIASLNSYGADTYQRCRELSRKDGFIFTAYFATQISRRLTCGETNSGTKALEDISAAVP
jgi:hypothetical protein